MFNREKRHNKCVERRRLNVIAKRHLMRRLAEMSHRLIKRLTSMDLGVLTSDQTDLAMIKPDPI